MKWILAVALGVILGLAVAVIRDRWRRGSREGAPPLAGSGDGATSDSDVQEPY